MGETLVRVFPLLAACVGVHSFGLDAAAAFICVGKLLVGGLRLLAPGECAGFAQLRARGERDVGAGFPALGELAVAAELRARGERVVGSRLPAFGELAVAAELRAFGE